MFHACPTQMAGLSSSRLHSLVAVLIFFSLGFTFHLYVCILTTCACVYHIHFSHTPSERQTRMKDLQEMEKKLTSSHSDLREQELKLKHQVRGGEGRK